MSDLTFPYALAVPLLIFKIFLFSSSAQVPDNDEQSVPDYQAESGKYSLSHFSRFPSLSSLSFILLSWFLLLEPVFTLCQCCMWLLVVRWFYLSGHDISRICAWAGQSFQGWARKAGVLKCWPRSPFSVHFLGEETGCVVRMCKCLLQFCQCLHKEMSGCWQEAEWKPTWN